MLPALLAAGSIAAPIIGGIIGNSAAQSNVDQAQADRQKAIEQWLQIHQPSVQEQLVVYEQLKSAGLLTPELEQTFSQGNTELNNVSVDPRLKQVQFAALDKLQSLSNDGGLSLTDKAKLNDIQNSLAQQEKGQRGAILQNAEQRGISGSGLELSSMLGSSQGSPLWQERCRVENF